MYNTKAPHTTVNFDNGTIGPVKILINPTKSMYLGSNSIIVKGTEFAVPTNTDIYGKNSVVVEQDIVGPQTIDYNMVENWVHNNKVEVDIHNDVDSNN